MTTPAWPSAVGPGIAAALSATAALLLLAGCSGFAAVPPPSFSDRPTLDSCGEVTLQQGEVIPADALECMDSAARGRGAELVVTSPTTEGDPIVRYFRVSPTIDGIEIFTDGTRDSFGTGQWTSDTGPGDVSLTEYGGCFPAPQ